ncbi:LytR/AlgR family response regulator transcription factor [Zhouia amylolytica]|uniref:Two-component system response regulator protein n=1 Tax=Zhouia amylolytica AD3 TaxID=1286632 RepID=W2UPK9_9FLAO|nr:LytTR family DNA-binding domain-containing protein [Zhouia amylolytica]ETN95874.1 two-component system response regulator protein [Zhouia amylolytica AD3]
MIINYIIVDDEHIAHDIIKDYCDRLPNMKLQKHCYDALEAFNFLQNRRVDLIFLDINMPKLKGFDLLKTLRNPPNVIVTTAYKEFALEGYELNISDYLLKPFSFERFLKAVHNTFDTAKESFAYSKITSTTSNRIFLKCNKKYVQLSTDKILYLESAGNYTKIVTLDDTMSIREKLSELLAILPLTDFVRVHRSFVVSKIHIKTIEGNRITIAQYTIPIGKIYKNNVIQWLGDS